VSFGSLLIQLSCVQLLAQGLKTEMSIAGVGHRAVVWESAVDSTMSTIHHHFFPLCLICPRLVCYFFRWPEVVFLVDI